MKNLFSLSILLISISAYSQVLTGETLVTSSTLNNSIDSIETSNALTQEKHPDWFDILKTNFGKREKSVADTVLLDSAYTYHFYSPDDSVLVLKHYANYNFDENKTMLSRFILDSLSGEWIHINEEAYYYDDWGNDSLLISDVKDTTNNTWVHDTKTEYDFDYNGNETYYAFYRWNNSLNLWIGSSKTVRNYDEKNRLLLLEAFSWDNDSNKWDIIIKHEYAFDSRGNKILDVSYGRDWQTNKLMPSYKYKYEFDENGNEILHASYSWDKEKGQWRGTSKSEGIFDENGNRILSWHYTWDYENDEWKYEQKSVRVFSETESSSETYFWNDELSQWYGFRKEEREFNSHGQDSITIDYEWSFLDTVWYKKSKTEYIYYKPDLFPSKIIYGWNTEINDWELDKKTELGFDDNDQLILEANYIWNHSLKAWKGDSKTEIYYNSNGDQTETIYYDFEEKHLQAVNTMIFSFDSDSLISLIPTGTNSEQNIVLQNSDYVEGTGSILWEYHIGVLLKWEEGCKIGIKNEANLTNDEGFYFDFKIINPTNANLDVLFKETSGEIWLLDDIHLLTNTSQLWKRYSLPFYELELAANEDSVNGILDLNSIDSVQFLIYDLLEENISGALLLDNLGTYQVKDTAFWKITARTENIYDDHGSRVFTNVYALDFNADTLKVTSKTKYDISYDANGNQTSYAEFQWNFYLNTWQGLYSKTERTYDDSSRIISDVRYFWDNEKEDWVGDRKRETSYDENGNKTSDALIYWNEAANKWIPDYKDEYYYDNENERTKRVYYDWNNSSEQWDVEYIMFYTKYNYLLDDNNNLILYEYVQWDENLLKWRAVEKYYFYYSTHQLNPTGILTETNEKTDVRVYPNPFNEKLVVETYSNEMELVIFDISGKKIMTCRLDKVRNEINLAELNRGLYIIQVFDEKNVVYNQKIIKH